MGHVFGEEKRASKDNVGLAAPLVQRHIQDAFEIEQRRTVDQDVYGSECLFGAGHGCCDLLFNCNVASEAQSSSTGFVD